MLDGTVTKDYLEDVAGPGEGDWAYRWWEYTFDFDGVRYRARVYTDEPARAYVLPLTDARSGDPDRRRVLVFIHDRLAPDGVTSSRCSAVKEATKSFRARLTRGTFSNTRAGCSHIARPNVRTRIKGGTGNDAAAPRPQSRT